MFLLIWLMVCVLCASQCVQNSGVLFIPETPALGWTGEQVVRMSGHGAVYVVSQHDYPQVSEGRDFMVLYHQAVMSLTCLISG